MKRVNNRRVDKEQERLRTTKELRLLELLRYWGFHSAAAMLDTRFIDLDNALTLWTDYPKCMDSYPEKFTKTQSLVEIYESATV